ncbi:helix-turn-helix domain-containing protein [Pannus brasiliensis CCIBt3594]|uniref:Helix-turn-helix domain-containing protein n=1 Tax=Pannus brasiliensis CCIBt3594 TaxID=1427578 RepID=A0AAW9QX84_9CHRO
MNQLSSLQTEQIKEIGGYLRQQRETRSLSIDDIAAMTRIRVPMLEALEDGDLDRLPEFIYVKGFIRRYGEALGLDGKSLAERLSPSVEQLTREATAPAPKKPPAKAPAKTVPAPVEKPLEPVSRVTNKLETPPPPPKQSKSPSFGMYLWLGILAGVCSGLGYLFLRPPFGEPSMEPTNPEQSPAASIAPSPVVSPSPVASPSPSPSPLTSLSATVNINDPSWLRVKVDGQTVYQGILKPGTTRTWTAKKTLNLRTGNAGGVKLSVNDKPAEVMGPLGQIDDRTFTLDTPNP